MAIFNKFSKLLTLSIVWLFCAISWARDMPPIVKVNYIGTNFVVFNVSGANTVDNLPVKMINVNYTQVASVKSLNSTVNIEKHILQYKLSFDRVINITNLSSGTSYQFQFNVINTKNEQGPSDFLEVLLKPQTPDFSITHFGSNTLQLFWGYPDEKYIDYFLLTVEKVRCN